MYYENWSTVKILVKLLCASSFMSYIMLRPCTWNNGLFLCSEKKTLLLIYTGYADMIDKCYNLRRAKDEFKFWNKCLFANITGVVSDIHSVRPKRQSCTSETVRPKRKTNIINYQLTVKLANYFYISTSFNIYINWYDVKFKKKSAYFTEIFNWIHKVRKFHFSLYVRTHGIFLWFQGH